ncbi:prostasin-like [Ylistrum balloti]|uniref:prostasin-like n=1 Tax=Ylistrum balloti TaxID=509963 RepID=UPI002905E0A4|nr:prostasin-like [Ylistrum balloti]
MDLFCITLVLLAFTASPISSQTVCQNSLHGTCINLLTGTSPCGSGNHLVLSYCGFLEACCYGSHHTTATAAPTSAPIHTGGSTGSGSGGQCGVPSVSGNHKIVGGSIATHGEYPWQVSLRYGGHHMCGGTLINEQWVVTAAHCFEDTQSHYWTVAVGIHDRSHVYRSQVHNAARVIVHEHYDKTRNHNDIAMIKLDKPVDTSSTYVKTACLPDPNENFDNAVCTVTGWGATHSGGQGTRYLEEVDVPVLTNSMCHYYMGNNVYSSNLCAGYSQGGKDACQGDSGGPLTCKRNGRWKLAGITSWGYGCGQRNAPGVYTRVSSFLSWIQTTQRNN